MTGRLELIRTIFRRWPAQVADGGRRDLVADAQGCPELVADSGRRDVVADARPIGAHPHDIPAMAGSGG